MSGGSQAIFRTMQTPTLPPTSEERAQRRARAGLPACSEIEHTRRNLAERDALSPDAPVIGAGCGRFIARRLAERLGRRYLDFGDLIDAPPETREMAARCAPAVAVALLAGKGA